MYHSYLRRLVPASSDTAKEVQSDTVLEAEERFVAVQPPRSWQRSTPAPHRRTPAGRLGEDIVTRLKAQLARGAAK